MSRGLPSRSHPVRRLSHWSYWVILIGVKTAISLSDETFERVTDRARRLGMSRSEFFARAAEAYLDCLDSELLTKRIDEALETIGPEDPSSFDAVTSGRHRLSTVDDEW